MTRNSESRRGRPVGSRRLSSLERATVLAKLAAGGTVPEVARATGISPTAVRTIRGVKPRPSKPAPVVRAAWTPEDEWRARAKSLRWGSEFGA